jgi:RNA polymerase sigma factor (sigma-70 family)
MAAGQAKRSWTGLFTEHRSGLRGFFARRGAHDEAEDMVQETWLRLLRAHQSGGEAIANPEAYLYTVATNLVREQATRRRPTPLPMEELEQLTAGLATGEAADTVAEREQRRQRLRAMLETLPERTRAVLVMQYRDGMSYQQIAERLGVSAHMVKKHVVRGLSACRRALDDGALGR